ncbi:MAG: hypothetical protein Q9162_005808 [Coniocarpon cinnabarinum]
MINIPDRSAVQDAFLDRPGVPVYFTFPTADRNSVTTFRIPRGSKFTPGPHWHELYDEHFKIIQGRAKVRVDGRERIVTPEDDVQIVPKFAIHELFRAEVGTGDDVIVEEWTDPADGFKEVFFRNLCGVVQDAPRFGVYTPVQVFTTLRYCDNYVVLFGGWFGRSATYFVSSLASKIAKWLRMQPVYPEYTPGRLKGVALSRPDARDFADAYEHKRS